MCNRYEQGAPVKKLVSHYRLSPTQKHLAELPPKYNVAPTNMVPVVHEEDDERILELQRWNLIPHWAKSIPKDVLLTNARAETIT